MPGRCGTRVAFRAFMLDATGHASWLALGGLALGGLTAASCITSGPVLPPGPLVRQLEQESLHATPPEGVRVESRRFAGALADYGSAVQRLMVGEGPLDEMDSGLFRRLAAAVAAVPKGELVGAPAAAESIRLDAIVLADRGATEKPRVAARALATAARALLSLARGPYRASPDVLDRARDLWATSAVISSGEPTPELIARGLREAELTLTAIEAIIP